MPRSEAGSGRVRVRSSPTVVGGPWSGELAWGVADGVRGRCRRGEDRSAGARRCSLVLAHDRTIGESVALSDADVRRSRAITGGSPVVLDLLEQLRPLPLGLYLDLKTVTRDGLRRSLDAVSSSGWPGERSSDHSIRASFGWWSPTAGLRPWSSRCARIARSCIRASTALHGSSAAWPARGCSGFTMPVWGHRLELEQPEAARRDGARWLRRGMHRRSPYAAMTGQSSDGAGGPTHVPSYEHGLQTFTANDSWRVAAS